EVIDKIQPAGIVGRRVIDTRKLFGLAKRFHVEFELSFDDMVTTHKGSTMKVIVMQMEKILGHEITSQLIDKSVKAQFAENKLWRFIRDHFNKDIQIPFITGIPTKNIIWRDNLVVTTGHARYSGQFGGVTTTPMTALAIGTSNVAPATTDTALGGEITLNGGARGAATVSQITTTLTNDTVQFQKTWTFTGTETIQEEGIFDNNTSGGTMGAHNTFASVTVNNGDSFEIIHKIQS
ncbi:MAG: hypothetical protein KGI08_11405, partial [Thaumarchaeota archaeon]|nr:hypothetical protein [Nitrososphaerota archaeon]